MNGNARDNIKPSQAELQIVLKLYKGEKRSAEQFAKALKDVDKELIEKRSKLEALDVLKFISTHTVDLLINAKALQISQKINYKVGLFISSFSVICLESQHVQPRKCPKQFHGTNSSRTRLRFSSRN
jgi:hypothetical protein